MTFPINAKEDWKAGLHLALQTLKVSSIPLCAARDPSHTCCQCRAVVRLMCTPSGVAMLVSNMVADVTDRGLGCPG